jgi:RNA polymerase sigma-70 factor (ECF subfamily)
LPAFPFACGARDLVTGTYGFRSSILTAFVRSGLNLLSLSGTDNDMAEAPLPSDGLRIDLAEWLRAHGNRLLRSAYLLCGDRTEAEDLVQETFLQAVKSAHLFRGESAIYTWLHGILLNLNRRRWRKQKRFIFDEEIVRQAASPNLQESEIDREFQTNLLSQAILALSAEHREVIVLRYYEELKLQQIAAQTGVSLGTVKSRLHYAMQCLEKLLPGELNLSAAKGTQTQSPR